jgi:hypothetical protein
MWKPDADGLDFQPERGVTAIELSHLLFQLGERLGVKFEFFIDEGKPNAVIYNEHLVRALNSAKMMSPGETKLKPTAALTRATLVRVLWSALKPGL